MLKEKCLLVYSGGLDSTVLLYHLLNNGYNVSTITFDYGQKHKKELNSALYFTKLMSVPNQIVDMSFYSKLLLNNVITSKNDVPDGHYADEIMKKTVVPNRNLLFLTVAVGLAIDSKIDLVAIACHSGDHTIYPDCRPEFIDSANSTMSLGNWGGAKIISPFVNFTKTDIVRLGADLNVPMEKTWSCYKGWDLHCGTCGTCYERKESFELANVKDSTGYV